MVKSNIFENFVKIAEKKGLVSWAEPEHTEKNLDNPRMDSLSIEQISKLYNTKPNLPEDMKYDKNIMEDAHPDPSVVSPAYDRLNGLVENEVEGQNIRIRIVLKEPDGHLTQRKYAEKQLILSLVKIGNDLDNHNQEDLRKLADACLMQATSPTLVKTALVPLIIGAVVVVLGAIALKQHTDFHQGGFETNYNNAMKELDDFSSDSAFIWGHSYRPEFIQLVQEIKQRLTDFHELYNGILPILDQMDAPRTGKELIQMAQQPEVQANALKVKQFREAAYNLYPYIAKIIQKFNDPEFTQRQVTDTGALTSALEWAHIEGGKNQADLVVNDFGDVVRALNPLLESLTQIMKSLQKSDSIEQQAKQELAQYAHEAEQKLSPTPETAAPPGETPPSEAAPPEAAAPTGEQGPATGGNAPWSDLEKELSGGLFGA